jgi:chemotaxis protein methyltransferase CheR
MTMNALTWTCPFEGKNQFVFDRDDFAAISKLVYAESGNVLSDGKAMLVYSRLTRRLRVTNTRRFADYIRLIEVDEEERRQAVNLLTTNHTYFNREEHHFEHFEREVRPHLLTRARSGNAVRIWSAGCSSGEEVFTLGMTLLGPDRAEGLRIANRDIAFLATDYADHVIEAGNAATYPAKSVLPMPEALRKAWTEPCGDDVRIAAPLRRMVRFRRLNLLAGWPLTKALDVIFCRNVMIYFDEPTKAQLLARFAENVIPGGYLYIGHSERLTGPATAAFELVGKTIYRRRG